MKLGRFCTLIAILLIGWTNAFAQSVSFSDIRLVHNVPDAYGRKMLQFHFKMTVSGCQGHDVKAYMFVDIPQGVGHKFANGNNMVVASNILKCSWPTTTTTGDWWVGIYNDQLNPLPGKRTYYTRLWVKDEYTGQWIGSSDFLSYELTGNAQPAYFNNNIYNNNNNIYNNNNNNIYNNNIYNNNDNSYSGRSRAEIQGDLNKARDFLVELEKDKELLKDCYSCMLQQNRTISEQKKFIRELELELSRAKY